MSEILHKATLKVRGFKFFEGQELIEDIEENDERRYPLYGDVRLVIMTNQGDLHVRTATPFVFDGRSGPKIVDFYAPNLGTIEERVCWLVHDCNGYGLDLSFKDTNVLLFAMLRDLAGYRPTKATLIQLAVSISKSWYGEPDPCDWCYGNKGLVSTEWVAIPPEK